MEQKWNRNLFRQDIEAESLGRFQACFIGIHGTDVVHPSSLRRTLWVQPKALGQLGGCLGDLPGMCRGFRAVVVDKKCGSILWKAAAELKALYQGGQERNQQRLPHRFGN